MKKLRIWSALLLCTMLLTGNASAASNFNPADARTARLEALELLETAAFQAEYNDHMEGKLTRWTDTIYIHVGGKPTKKDLAALEDFIMELAVRVPLLPNIYLVSDEASANITIDYVPLKEMAEHVSDYVEGNWGYFSFWYNDSVRNRAQIAICTNKTNQKQRNHLMMEELIGVLALSQDHYVYRDSIVYQEWTETQALSDVDWLMMNMVYSPYVTTGMAYNEVYEIYYPLITK